MFYMLYVSDMSSDTYLLIFSSNYDALNWYLKSLKTDLIFKQKHLLKNK